MFDDLIIDKRKNIDTFDYRNAPKCIKCFSQNLKKQTGGFINATDFRFKVKCRDCNYTWFISIDSQNEVFNIEGCGYEHSKSR